METSVEFDSTLFSPFLPEESQVNPGVYGAELAFWLAKQLANQGVIATYPDYEDWGWFIEYITDEGDEYWLCCTNREGLNDEWTCYLEPKAKSFFGFNKAKIENAKTLLDALHAVLTSEAQIRNIRWCE